MGKVVLLTQTGEGVRACASAARISTTGGGAAGQYTSEHDAAKDLSLVKKVLKSGHQSIFEHHTCFVGFEDVSVAVEQFVIEARLGSYTVKSRRYVDFTGAGYVVPEDLGSAQRESYTALMEKLFALYARLLEGGISREDARFVLPYCFCSNFYMTMNARELSRLIAQMTVGRGSANTEIRTLGESLKAQFEETWPGVIDLLTAGMQPSRPYDGAKLLADIECKEAVPSVKLTQTAPDAAKQLREMMDFCGRDPEMTFADLVRDPRPRELEFLQYGFAVENVSLACVTHFTRHRIQSILIGDVRDALADGRFIVPDAVREQPELYAEYCAAFRESREVCRRLLAEGMPCEYASYFALAGNTLPLRISMNARELALFLRLRTCERAQWEIRRLARDLLKQLRADALEVFGAFGPGCLSMGKCPEGRLSCGHPPVEM